MCGCNKRVIEQQDAQPQPQQPQPQQTTGPQPVAR
jgi:hypothetical protein